jgi:hypothetical protein
LDAHCPLPLRNGEEVERLVSDDPALDAWLAGRNGND